MVGAIILFIFGAVSLTFGIFMLGYSSLLWLNIGFIALGVILLICGVDRLEKEYGFLNSLFEKRDKRYAKKIDKATGGLLTKAVKRDAVAQVDLGYRFSVGKGVKKDYKQAFYWFTKSAEKGNATAQYNLGCCYFFGEGVAQDYEQAFVWHRKAAEQGLADAQYNLGCSYYFGKGVAQNYEQAFVWYKKAAEQGFAKAQYNLGRCYYLGDGVKKDREQTIYWCKKAAKQGDQKAKKFLATLNA